MGNEHIDIFLRNSCFFQSAECCLSHMTDSRLEHFRAFHMDINTFRIDGSVRNRFCHAACRDIQNLAKTSVGSKLRCQKTVAFIHLSNDRCSCAIAEENTCRTVLPVNKPGKNFSTYDQNIIIHARLDHV